MLLFPANPAAVAATQGQGRYPGGQARSIYNPGATAGRRGTTVMANRGRRLPRRPITRGMPRRPSSVAGGGIGYPVPRLGFGGAPAMPPGVAGTSVGFPVGSINFRPSKMSGGFSNIVRTDTSNRRTGSMNDIDARRVAAENAGLAAMDTGPGPQVASSASRWNPTNGGGAIIDRAAPGSPQNPTGQAYPDEIMNFFEAMQNAENQANAKNEARYNDILGGYNIREANAMRDVAALGTSQRRAIDDQHTKTAASLDQDLIERGLGNTTLRGSQMADLGEVRGRLMQDLEEKLARNRIDLGTQLSGDRLGFMERRTDEGPDVRLSTMLAGQLGEAGFGDDWGGTYGGAGRQVPYQPGMPVAPQPLYPQPNGGIAQPIGGSQLPSPPATFSPMTGTGGVGLHPGTPAASPQGPARRRRLFSQPGSTARGPGPFGQTPRLFV